MHAPCRTASLRASKSPSVSNGLRASPSARTSASARKRLHCTLNAEGPTYQGRYSSFTITAADELEVTVYRASVTALALAFDVGALSPVLNLSSEFVDAATLVGALSLGSALLSVHMYLSLIKRTMQLLCAFGSVSGLALFVFAAHDQSVAAYVHGHPLSVFLVGPFFAALTGLAFKEGACYGKGESIALFFLIPALLLSTLAGASDAAQTSLLFSDAVLLSVWAARKWTQAVKDDVGDKSVFAFQRMPAEEQAALEARLQQRGE